jgi:hypothetical protein
MRSILGDRCRLILVERPAGARKACDLGDRSNGAETTQREQRRAGSLPYSAQYSE